MIKDRFKDYGQCADHTKPPLQHVGLYELDRDRDPDKDSETAAAKAAEIQSEQEELGR